MRLAKRAEDITPSATLSITAKAKELREKGKDVIGLGAGEPDFNTPDHIIEAAYKSMKNGETKYTPSGGLASLKQAIIRKLSRDQQLEYAPSEVIVTTGAKHALYTLFQAILDKDDEVIIPTPYWVSYPEQVKLAGGVPVFVEGQEEHQLKITIDALERSVTDRTKALILNSPSNPTGMVYTNEELQAIGDLCVRKGIWIVSDEIYEKLLYHGATHTSIAQLSQQLQRQTIVINGLSKSHSMTGWRMGFAAGDKKVIEAMTNIASHSTSNPTTTTQYGAIAAYDGPQEPVENMRLAFQHRLDTVFEKLSTIPGFHCEKPQGAFYLFPNVTEAVERTGFANVEAFSTALLEEANVAVVPGTGFGSPDHLRISYATDLDTILVALERIERFVKERWDSTESASKRG
ncbi:pyridoxal phosphate-dependent aminotransferase [Bacillus fonticola]|uniref:pyridoxal phosphate-dependent aminotransferase n=1 Tax=Bacillus fonticola TaxID=2728853 RepID=UPI001473994A|nr:pyridoxal phosphate-dependent aminotransferase [Bacillus fonticola]